jgi:phosphoserine phosphatase
MTNSAERTKLAKRIAELLGNKGITFTAPESKIAVSREIVDITLKDKHQALRELAEKLKQRALTKPWVMTDSNENNRLYALTLNDISDCLNEMVGGGNGS